MFLMQKVPSRSLFYLVHKILMNWTHLKYYDTMNYELSQEFSQEFYSSLSEFYDSQLYLSLLSPQGFLSKDSWIKVKFDKLN